MPLFLTIQTTYQDIQIALCKANVITDVVIIDKMNATKQLVSTLDALLNAHHCSLRDLTFIAANAGPGPFTTLRTVLANVNGLRYATNIPLVGLHGLAAFADEHKDPQWPCSVYLFNAFAKDVYYALDYQGTVATMHYQNIYRLLDELQMHTIYPIRFLGNGATLYQNLISERFGSNAFIPAEAPLFCSMKHLALRSLQQWQLQQYQSSPLMPLYLKNHEVKSA